ncbi:MAG: type II toxin-antitoxin system RelE/ParE family toxin [Chloroflexia bacterium]
MPEVGYTITFTRSARREIERLPSNVVQRVYPHIEALAENPRPPGCHKIVGAQNLWRIRVGDYRVVYEVLDEAQVVDIIVVRHRSEAYR